MLNTQKYLQNHSLESLENEFGIVITKYDDRVVLNYSQIESPKFHPICDECRGLILSYPNYNVLCRSFDRFYNYGEGGYFSKEEFDITRAETQQKIDGSLINLYYDGDKWCCATRKMAFSEGETNKGNTFKEVVERALGFPIEKISLNSNYTYICEVVSPETRVVVPYKEYKLYLLAVRDRWTGEYSHKNVCGLACWALQVEMPNMYKFNNFDEIIKTVKELEPMNEDGEGYVCYDPVTQNRIKIKNPSYLALANLRENGTISNKNIAKLVIEQDYEEYLNYFPEDLEFFQPYINAYNRLMYDIDRTWNQNKDIEDQKEFALNVKDKEIGSIMFSLRKGLTLSKIFDKLFDKKKIELLETYKEGK